MSITFRNLYDGNERKDLFVGDMRFVPTEDMDFSSWMTVITYFDEENERASITADLVYLTNPQLQVTVRLKAMVKGSNVRSSK